MQATASKLALDLKQARALHQEEVEKLRLAHRNELQVRG